MKDILILAAAAAGLFALLRWSRRPEAEESVHLRSLATSVALQRMARYDRERWERFLRYFAAWETKLHKGGQARPARVA